MNFRKQILAKMLASENIDVRWEAGAQTASFDVKNRVLRMPIFKKDISNALTDMFIEHEVAHALWSPGANFMRDISSMRDDGKVSSIAKAYINVVEDARIERKIKMKYPGVREDFITGYRELQNMDFFGLNGSDGSDRPFIDRINLHYKIGHIVEQKFSEAERVFIDKINRISTWDDTLRVAREIYEFSREQLEKEQEQENPEDNASSPDEAEDEGDDNEGSESSSSDKSEDGEESSGDDADGASSDDDADDADDETRGSIMAPEAESSVTENKMNDALSSMVDTQAKSRSVRKFAKFIDTTQYVVPMETFAAGLGNWRK